MAKLKFKVKFNPLRLMMAKFGLAILTFFCVIGIVSERARHKIIDYLAAFLVKNAVYAEPDYD